MKRKDNRLADDSREDLVSMILGLIIVGVVIGLIFNFIQKRKGSVSVPGISSSQISIVNNPSVAPTKMEKQIELETKMYEVSSGDNLWDIGEKFYGNGYKWVDIAKENNLLKPDFLMVGQKLKLSSLKPAGTSSKEYIVQKGDSLWKISSRLYGDGLRWIDIWNQNKSLISDPDYIEIGAKLALP